MVSAEQARLPDEWANPRLLSWARTRIGLTPEYVATLRGIAPETILAWERGEGGPTLRQLEILAELYACPVGCFFLDSPPTEKLPLDFRGLAEEKRAVLSYETHLRLREFDRLTDYAGSLLDELKLGREVRVRSASPDDPVDSVARIEREELGITQEMRQQWLTADQAFQSWKGGVEASGVFVLELKLNPQEVRGASKWVASQVPAILVNHADMEATTGRIFTLLHEWAHLLLRRPGVVCDFRGEDDARIERFANRFAAEAMIPRAELEDYLRHKGLFEAREAWGDAVLGQIRETFKVSKDVIAVLLEEMKLAPPGFYRSKRAAWDRLRPFFRSRVIAGGRTGWTKARRRRRELGNPLTRLLATGYERQALSNLDLADLLNMRVEQAERFVSWVQEEPMEG